MKYTEISFPAFGITMNPGASFTIGPFTIHIYGLLIAAGLLLAVLYAYSRSKQFGLKDDDITDGVLCVTPFAILCARLYYCIFEWDRYASNPISILYIWEGGLAIYGGVIAGVLAAWAFSKKKKIPFGVLADLVAPTLILGQAIGRWGNFFNGEAYGYLVENPALQFFPIAVFVDGQWHMATFFYESMWNFAGFILLWRKRKSVQIPGNLFLGYLMWYGAGRAVIEGLRTDSLMLGPLRVSQMLSLALVLFAFCFYFIRSHRKKMP